VSPAPEKPISESPSAASPSQSTPEPVGPLRVAVLISGGGTTLANLIDKIRARALDVEIGCVVSSNPSAGGLKFAAQAGIPSAVIERRGFADEDAFSQAVFEACRAAGARLVVMGGFLKHVLIPADFENRVVNIHPALIPDFCGHGFYGHRVHKAVLAAGVRVSGCTVHFVDNQYDHGPIILRREVPVEPGDTPDMLAARVFKAECEAYPEALRLIAAGRVRVEAGAVQID
jgi:phosphoribosylglycinamide formyltransferase 1